jgi:hypothetical protein
MGYALPGAVAAVPVYVRAKEVEHFVFPFEDFDFTRAPDYEGLERTLLDWLEGPGRDVDELPNGVDLMAIRKTIFAHRDQVPRTLGLSSSVLNRLERGIEVHMRANSAQVTEKRKKTETATHHEPWVNKAAVFAISPCLVSPEIPYEVKNRLRRQVIDLYTPMAGISSLT